MGTPWLRLPYFTRGNLVLARFDPTIRPPGYWDWFVPGEKARAQLAQEHCNGRSGFSSALEQLAVDSVINAFHFIRGDLHRDDMVHASQALGNAFQDLRSREKRPCRVSVIGDSVCRQPPFWRRFVGTWSGLAEAVSAELRRELATYPWLTIDTEGSTREGVGITILLSDAPLAVIGEQFPFLRIEWWVSHLDSSPPGRHERLLQSYIRHPRATTVEEDLQCLTVEDRLPTEREAGIHGVTFYQDLRWWLDPHFLPFGHCANALCVVKPGSMLPPNPSIHAVRDPGWTETIARIAHIALHEIGHAMGLAHHVGGPALMNPYTVNPLNPAEQEYLALLFS